MAGERKIEAFLGLSAYPCLPIRKKEEVRLLVNPRYVEKVKEIEKRLKTAFKEYEVEDIDIIEEPEIFQKKKLKSRLTITITLRGN